LDITTAVDHIRVGVADLDYGIARLEHLTGVRPVRGGSHPGVGTHNALFSLGDTQYLELIAPDPAQRQSTVPSELRTLIEPRVIAWIARTLNIKSSADVALKAGYRLDGPTERSRVRPDGKCLTWKLFRVLNTLGRDGVEPIPEFIEWDPESLHPSQDSPKGCKLHAFDIEYPQPPTVTTALKNLGIEAHVTQAMSARLIIALKTPTGRVELS
jgi:hypothetical protein